MIKKKQLYKTIYINTYAYIHTYQLDSTNCWGLHSTEVLYLAAGTMRLGKGISLGTLCITFTCIDSQYTSTYIKILYHYVSLLNLSNSCFVANGPNGTCTARLLNLAFLAILCSGFHAMLHPGSVEASDN